MAKPYPVIVICIATLAATFGAAVFAAAAPNGERACAEGELVAERFFAIEAAGESGRRAEYFVELANPQARPRVFNIAFDLEDAADRRNGERAMSLTGRQSLPVMLGTQPLDEGAAPLTPAAMAAALRLHCRAW